MEEKVTFKYFYGDEADAYTSSVQILSMGFHRCIFDYFQSGDCNMIYFEDLPLDTKILFSMK